MDNFKHKQRLGFCLEGRFLGFASDEVGKLKYLRLGVEMRELQIKLPKESRAFLMRVLKPNDPILVAGTKKLDKHTGQFKLKADRVNKLSLESEQESPPYQILPQKRKAKIMVCQKSGCLKRGGKNLLSSLEATLCDRGLQDRVSIEPTGCLKCCSQAPNMVLIPGKTRLSGMHPEAIATLIENL
jgi:hypothetical protein